MPANRNPEEKRERVLDVALGLFADRGFHGTSVPSVATGANVAAGSIYRYFDSKEALVNALYRREKQRFIAEVTKGLLPEASPRQQFHEFLHAVFSYAASHPDSVKFLEHHHHQSYLDEESRRLEAYGMGLAVTFLEQTSAAKITKPLRPEVLITVVWGTLVMILKQCWEGQLELTSEIETQVERVLWEAVRL